MKFDSSVPKYNNFMDIKGVEEFLKLGQEKFKSFLVNFLSLEQVRLQTCCIDDLKKWLNVSEISEIMEVSDKEDEICVVSQIKTDEGLIAFFPYVLKGRDVKIYMGLSSLLSKMAEAVSDQITMCYLQKFTGCDWIFGENLARIIVSNCISTRRFDGSKFAHLIEKMEQLSVATFEGDFFSTGVIVCSDLSKYRKNFFQFNKERKVDSIDKREWFLADGKDSFYIIDSSDNIEGIFIKDRSLSNKLFKQYFDDYYMQNSLGENDFIIRTVGPNEISVSDNDGKEFVKVENVWRYRHYKNITSYLVDKLKIDYKVSYAILYYVLKCSRNHISSIIWIPDDCENVDSYTTDNRVRLWKEKLSILEKGHNVIIEKILASDGAMVLEKNGDILYESVFADMSKAEHEEAKLVGSGETATKLLAKNGVAVKISQDGTIKVFAGDEKMYY